MIGARVLASVVLLFCAFAPAAQARTSADGLPVVALKSLPKEARTIYEAVHKGGPFAYDRDGVVFGNREHLLPAKPRGYYHEYTVPSPKTKGRGARRIVCGGTSEAAPDLCYYSDDHYQSFKRIRE